MGATSFLSTFFFARKKCTRHQKHKKQIVIQFFIINCDSGKKKGNFKKLRFLIRKYPSPPYVKWQKIWQKCRKYDTPQSPKGDPTEPNRIMAEKRADWIQSYYIRCMAKHAPDTLSVLSFLIFKIAKD
jgi:hypothetical protein